jgi:hypothetical protein
MAVKPESRFYRRVNDKLPQGIHYQKIGSASENGTPDFWYSGSKADAWVEYKWLLSVPRIGCDVTKELSALQRRWLNLRMQEGRLVIVIVGSPQGCAVLFNGAWNARVPLEEFRYAPSEVSALLTETIHALSEIAGQSCNGDQPDISDSGNDATHRGNRV